MDATTQILTASPLTAPRSALDAARLSALDAARPGRDRRLPRVPEVDPQAVGLGRLPLGGAPHVTEPSSDCH